MMETQAYWKQVVNDVYKLLGECHWLAQIDCQGTNKRKLQPFWAVEPLALMGFDI